MMHLTREAIDAWAAAARFPETGRNVTLRLEEGDSMPCGIRVTGEAELTFTGPAIVELVVYRDGGWSARELVYETPESIALAASLAQRQPPCACGRLGHRLGGPILHERTAACPLPRIPEVRHSSIMPKRPEPEYDGDPLPLHRSPWPRGTAPVDAWLPETYLHAGEEWDR